MASQLSDEELREKLVGFGEDVGPLTETTRPLWERKLKSLIRTRKRSTPKNLNAFSSDDSEKDTQENHDADRLLRKKRNHMRTSVSNAYIGVNNRHSSSTPKDDVFKKPAAIIGRPLGISKSKRFLSDSENKLKNKKRPAFFSAFSSYNVETSDSDLDSESPTNRLTNRLRNESSEDQNGDKRYFNSQHRTKTNEKSDGFVQRIVNVPIRKTSSFASPSFAERWSLRKSIDSVHDKSSVNGYISVDSELNKEFSNQSAVSGKTTNYSHCVSWMLVLGTAAFFIVIGMVYMSEVHKGSQNLPRNNYLSLCCKNNEKYDCVPKKYLKPAVQLSRDLHSLLARAAGDYECQGTSERRMALSHVTDNLKVLVADQNITESFDDVFKYAIWLISKHPEWQIIIHRSVDSSKPISNIEEDFQHISALESEVAAKSFWCRMQHSFRWTMTDLFIVFLVLASILVLFYGVKYWKHWKETDEKEMYELVEKIIEILQKSDEGSDPSSGSPPYKAVVHVRDMLIPPKERKAKQKLWNRAVNFIEETESRVRVEERPISGESFKVWIWLSNSTPEGEGGRQGKVWQGQAFRNLSKGCPYGATPCLKIRNMFDPEVEYGDDWQVSIQDAILDKCESNNGIVHVAVDPTPSEGCVFLMCNSSEAAGKAFHALHGWWFDGKLVTVKYLRSERYLERFPSAAHCVEPLKPSNNERLSLSAPFFSSALERS